LPPIVPALRDKQNSVLWIAEDWHDLNREPATESLVLGQEAWLQKALNDVVARPGLSYDVAGQRTPFAQQRTHLLLSVIQRLAGTAIFFTPAGMRRLVEDSDEVHVVDGIKLSSPGEGTRRKCFGNVVVQCF
jgi:hypothetical protein